jgi:hypothetical protein
MFAGLGMPDPHFETDYSDIEEPVARSYFNFGS